MPKKKDTNTATLADYMSPRRRTLQWTDPVIGKVLYFSEMDAMTFAQLQADIGAEEMYVTDFRADYLAAHAELERNGAIDEQKALFLQCYDRNAHKILVYRIAALSSKPKLKPEHAAVLVQGLTPEQTKDLNKRLTALIILSLEAELIKNSQSSPDQ